MFQNRTPDDVEAFFVYLIPIVALGAILALALLIEGCQRVRAKAGHHALGPPHSPQEEERQAIVTRRLSTVLCLLLAAIITMLIHRGLEGWKQVRCGQGGAEPALLGAIHALALLIEGRRGASRWGYACWRGGHPPRCRAWAEGEGVRYRDE